jgi:hypothetical protein
MIEFRNSDDFITWRKLAGPHFQSPPRVEHLQIVIESEPGFAEAASEAAILQG